MAWDGDLSMPLPPGPDPDAFLQLAIRLADQAGRNVRIARRLFLVAAVLVVVEVALLTLTMMHFYGIFYGSCS